MRRHHPENERIKRQYFRAPRARQRPVGQQHQSGGGSHLRIRAQHELQGLPEVSRRPGDGLQGAASRPSKSGDGEVAGKGDGAIEVDGAQGLHCMAFGATEVPGAHPLQRRGVLQSIRKRRAHRQGRSRASSPTLDQIWQAVELMPTATILDRRDRAVVAFGVVSGARDNAIASFSLKHIDPAARTVFQDAREVRTKFAKTFTSTYFPVDRGSRLSLATGFPSSRRSGSERTIHCFRRLT